MIYVYSENKKYDTDAKNLVSHLNLMAEKNKKDEHSFDGDNQLENDSDKNNEPYAFLLERSLSDKDEPMKDSLRLCYRKKGLSLECGNLSLTEDFENMISRVKEKMWMHELLAKAASFKNSKATNVKQSGAENSKEKLKAIDATCGLGEDSLILAAAGFEVLMFERNPVIAALLKDAIRRAKKNQILKEIVGKMKVVEGDSIELMPKLEEEFDVIYLDPMFPEKQKSALTKKKFQLLHMLESPAIDGDALLNSAMKVNAKKIIIKRPPSGPYLGNVKPSYSIEGKAVRFDCIQK